MKRMRIALILASTLFFSIAAPSQDEARIQKLFQDAIQLMGGEAYLGVTDVVSEGNLFFFSREGSSGLIKYNDYTKFPDKSRNEQGNRKKERDISVFNLEKNEGWIQEGQKETRAATPDELKGFRNSVKHSLDNILRFRYKDPHNKLFYMGPGEGSDVQFDLVKLLDEENDEVTIYFDRASKMPVKVEYRAIGKHEVRLRIMEDYSQWHVTQGINTPLRTDTYRNGAKFSQQFILKVTYNNNLPDSLFVKPEPQK
jgi:hypothetical protein